MSRPSGSSDQQRAPRSGRWPELALIGAYPPPYGGVSVHVQRLAAHLEKEGVDFVVYNTVSAAERPPRVRSIARQRVLRTLWFCLRHRCRLVHLSVTLWMAHVLFGMTALLRRGVYVMTIHNMRTNEAMLRGGFVQRRLTRWMLRRFDVIIAVSDEIAKACIEIAKVPPDRVHVIPDFISPDPTQAPALPEAIAAFADRADPLLYGMTWLGREYRGVDLYGTDMMVDLIERLQGDYPNVGLVLTALGGDPASLAQWQQRARSRTGERIFWMTEPLSDVSKLMQASDLYLRPTNTDGDSIAVREALCLGTPVVASDAALRPDGSVLFQNRDADDFEQKVRDCLKDLPAVRSRVASCDIPDNAARIVDIYRDLLRSEA